MSALIDAKPDVLACETIPCLKEALAVAKLLQEFPGIYGWISFSAKDGMHINSGESMVDCAKALDGFDQIAAVGVNCTAPAVSYTHLDVYKRQTATALPAICLRKRASP